MTPNPYLDVHYIDGLASRLRPARMQMLDGNLYVVGEGFERVISADSVTWPENMGQPVLVAHVSDGAQLQSLSAAQWHAWQAHYVGGKNWIAKAQVSRKWAAGAVLGLVIFAFGFWRWGVDWTSQLAVALTPPSVDVLVGKSALLAMDGSLLKPSGLTQEQKADVEREFNAVVAAVKLHQKSTDSLSADERLQYALHFRSSVIGANAFALPGGGIVMTDEMVTLLQGEPDAVAGVLGHEIGHVIHRHGMLLMYKSGAVALFTDFLLGDVSSLLATAPALISQAHYSRVAECEADQVAADLLKAMGRSPLAMVTLFEKLQAFYKQGANADGDDLADKLGISFSSHPSDSERVNFFKQQAGQ